MAKQTVGPEEAKRRKAQKRLEALCYTPQAAKMLSEVLRALHLCTPEKREAILTEFQRIAREA